MSLNWDSELCCDVLISTSAATSGFSLASRPLVMPWADNLTTTHGILISATPDTWYILAVGNLKSYHFNAKMAEQLWIFQHHNRVHII